MGFSLSPLKYFWYHFFRFGLISFLLPVFCYFICVRTWYEIFFFFFLNIAYVILDNFIDIVFKVEK